MALPNTLGLPESEGVFALSGNIFCNKLSQYISTWGDLAIARDGKLDDTIDAMQAQFNTSVGLLTKVYSATLVGSEAHDDFFVGIEVPTLDAMPIITTIPIPGTAPTAPNPGTALMDTAAYDAAFALARAEALAEQARADWETSYGAAASGIGLPYAAQQAALQQSAQAQAKLTSQAALTQAQLRASHVREDNQFAYQQQLAYFVQLEQFLLSRWKDQNTTAIALWSEVFKTKIGKLTAQLSLVSAQIADFAESRAWWTVQNANTLQKAKDEADAARYLQQALIDVGKEFLFAIAGARAQEFQAFLGAASTRLSGEGKADPAATFAG